MSTELFTRELIQAVSDWQRGGSHDQKVKRGQRLKAAAASLPERFQTYATPCFRQETHEKDRVWQLLADNHLPETIASWTIDIGVAKTLKGGVPPPGLHGVIFKITPPKNSVILNLTALNADPGFQAAVETHKDNINGYHDGLGRYQDSQREVVLELGNLEQASVYSYGGFSSNRETLVELHLQRKPSPEDLAEFDDLAKKAGITPGGEWWLSESGTQAVLGRMQPLIKRLSKERPTRRNHDAWPSFSIAGLTSKTLPRPSTSAISIPAVRARAAIRLAKVSVTLVRGTTANWRRPSATGVASESPITSQSPCRSRESCPACRVLMMPPLHSATIRMLPTSATTSPRPELGLTTIVLPSGVL